MKVASVQVVSTFEDNRQAILTAGQKFLAMAKKLNAIVQQVNVPEIAPPDVPRILFQRSDLLAAMSYARLEVTARPPSHVAGDFAAALDFAERSAMPIIAEFVEGEQRYRWTGVIVHVLYPMSERGISSIEHAKHAFDRMLRVDRGGRDLGAFNVQFGFQSGGTYQGFTVSGYEIRTFSTPTKPSALPSPESGELQTAGIEIYIDVNNKRAETHRTATSEASEILQEHRKLHGGMLDLLNLRGVLDGSTVKSSKTAA